ncbi:MAG: Hsp20/alpha crystallin family protein, partial [Elusimicrobiota bacterium]
MRRGLIPKESLRDLMGSDFFDRMFSRSPFSMLEGAEVSPAVDLINKKDRLIAKAELPGIDKDDLNVEVEDGLLKIRGESKKEEEVEDKDYYRCERYYGSFSRNVKLPDAVDKN